MNAQPNIAQFQDQDRRNGPPPARRNWLVALGGRRVRAMFDATAPLAASPTARG